MTGAGGLVGGKIVQQLLEMDEISSIHAIYSRQPDDFVDLTGRLYIHVIDLTKTEEIVQLMMKVRPGFVLHAAAMTNVDACEYERERAYAINVACTDSIAHACAIVNARLVYVSTDYVFDGSDEQPGPYTEYAPVHPLNYYGLTKLQGEQAVQKRCEGSTGWAICRSTVIYGQTSGTRMNFVLWLIRELRAGHTVYVVKDQLSTPTLADHLASMLIAVGLRGKNGIYHTAGADYLDRLSFAQHVADVFALDASLLQPITTADLQQAALRPLRGGLLCNRIKTELGIQPLPIHSGIDIVRSQLSHQLGEKRGTDLN